MLLILFHRLKSQKKNVIIDNNDVEGHVMFDVDEERYEKIRRA